jgi:hypothetical protein
VRERQPEFVSFGDWKKLDAIEVERGAAKGRPRVKLTIVEDMIAAIAGGVRRS